MPLEIRQAYENGTRSFDGEPGRLYWQNNAKYTIDVEILPSKRIISGREEVVYYNRGPHELQNLVLRLYHDVNKKGAVRAYSADAGDLTEGVKIHQLSINGKSRDLEDRDKVQRSGTNIKLWLEEPLGPGDSLVLRTSWQQEIPVNDTRVGSYDSTSFFIGYWYPQLAVYDDIFGWDELNHGILNEFYNGPADFKVSVTAPEAYLVWATGKLTNAEDLYPPDILEKYNAAWSSKEVLSLVSGEDITKGIPTGKGVWHFEASEVNDFAFFLSDHFAWDAVSLEIDGRKRLISTVFPASMDIDSKANVSLSRDAMRFFSEGIPGVAFPFESFTTVIADGWGMEFPMMAHNSSPGPGVTIHEMLHSFIPMYVHSNESRWSWMDEGWVSLWTQIAIMELTNGGQDIIQLMEGFGQGLILGNISDLPLMVSSEYLNDFNYGQASYSKPAFILTMILHHMGEKLFLECSREFIDRWAGKSPTPYDFFYTFEHVSGQDLGWLWKPWFFDFGFVDVKIESFSKGELGLSLLGNLPVPLVIDVEYRDGSFRRFTESVDIWSEGRQGFSKSLPDHEDVVKIILNKNLPDSNRSNNIYPVK